jgi:glycosyltransferase involved in cell wall biosynthesis
VTPQPAQADPRDALALQLQQAFAARDVIAICGIGKAAHQDGALQLAAQACDAAVSILNVFIARGEAEAVFFIEGLIYDSFVKAVEDEDHYERIFSGWREPMAALGRRFREPVRARADAQGVGFVLPSSAVLGHTEVLLRLLENRARDDVRIYTVGPGSEDLLARAAALGVPVESCSHPGVVDRLRWLRERIAADGMRTAVWVSVPAGAIFALSMGLAPVQVMWSLRYHPVRLPEIDGYLTYGSWGEEARVFHGQRWVVCPVPLALDPRLPAAGDVAALRARFPHKVLLGTLAREEKLASEPFLRSVAEILRRNPDCGYLWTGREPHPGIASFFQREGLGARTHFVGWVDTPLYASILDVFLETFPLGCGITGYQALAAGVPVVSYLDANTIFGMQYWSGLMARAGSRANVTREMLDEYPVLCARDPQEYAALASRLIADAGFRDEWRARETRFFAEEIAGIARYSKRFFGAIGDVAARKAA